MKTSNKFRFKLSAVLMAVGSVLNDAIFGYMGRTGMVLKLDDDEGTPAGISKKLNAITDLVREKAQEAVATAEKGQKLHAKTQETVDELLTKQGELQARLSEAEKKLATQTAEVIGRAKSIGEELTESDAFKAYVAEGNFKRSFNFNTKAVVDLTTTANGIGSSLIQADRLPGMLQQPVRRLTVRDLITPGRTNSNLIQYVRELGFQNMAATVAEGTRKPQSDVSFDMASTPVVKIAHFIKASTEILADVPMLQSYVDGRLRYMLSYVEELQLLKGSGVGTNLNGIYTQATAYVAPFAMADATMVDTLRLALLKSELAQFPSTGIVMNPIAWARIQLMKNTSTGEYLWTNPQSQFGANIWGRPIVETTAMGELEYLAGAFRLGAQVFDRQQANVMVATENEDDFVNNMVTILAEERLGLAVYRPEAFIKGTFPAAV